MAGFELLDELGRGGMGVVYKARQLSLDRIVAIKFLPGALAKDEKKVQRFIREARAAGKLSHPNIVAAYDVGHSNGVYYIAMEYVDGQSAHQLLKHRGALPEDEVLEIGMQAAQALRSAHAAGILHRDIKPDNFLMDSNGTLKLADLGLARFEGDGAEDGHLTQDGTALGTPHYMSPEAARGNKLDARSDLYSLGASLYLLATNLTPFTAPTSAAILVKVISENPRPLRQTAPHLSASFVAVIEKLMHKDPAHRIQSADEVFTALKKVKSGPRVAVGSVRDVPWKPSLMPEAGPKPVAPILFAVLGGGLALLVLGLILYATRTPVEPERTAGAPVTRTPTTAKPETSGSTKAPLSAPQPEPASKKAESEQVSPARKTFERLSQEQSVRLRRDPVQLAEEWEKLIRENPSALFIDRARRFSSEARVAADARLKDWQATKDQASEALARNEPKAAASAYRDFISRNPETAEAREADTTLKELHVKVLTWIREQTTLAKSQADSGEFAAAQASLDRLKDLPRKLYEEAEVAQIAEAIQKQRQETESRQTQILDADRKRLQEAHKKAQTLVRDSSDPFQFSQAADTFGTAEKLVELAASKSDAKAWVERYARAGKVWETVRDRAKGGLPDELTSLGRFPVAGKVTGTETRGLAYSSSKLPAGGQLVPWRDLTPENDVELAKQVGPSALDLGLFAYAVGAFVPALELLDPSKYTDETEQALAKGAWERIQLVAREQLAQTALSNAKAARERNDAKATGEALAAFGSGGPLADTGFARDHAAEITAIKEWTEKAMVGTKTAAQTPETDPAQAPSQTTPETIAELKKLGWDSVEGLWVPIPDKKNMYKATGARLVLNTSDAAGKVLFKLTPGAQVSLLVRNENKDQPPMFREGMRQFLGEVSSGYGAAVTTTGVKLFEPWSPPEGLGRRGGPMRDFRLPIGRPSDWPVKDGVHELTVQVQGDTANIEFDRQYKKSINRIRPTGNLILEIQGTVDIQMPQAQKL